MKTNNTSYEKVSLETNRNIKQDVGLDIKTLQQPTKSYIIKLGNTIGIFPNKKGNPLFIIGPDWKLYFCLTSTVTLFYSLYLLYMSKRTNKTLNYCGILIYSSFIIFYTWTFLKNPGYPKEKINKISLEQKDQYEYCQVCGFYIDTYKGVVHCKICNICVEGYDHHCPWTGKCVGAGNIGVFHWFVLATFGMIGFFICAVANS